MLFADRLKETAKLIVIVKSMTNDKHEKVHLSSPLLSSPPSLLLLPLSPSPPSSYFAYQLLTGKADISKWFP